MFVDDGFTEGELVAGVNDVPLLSYYAYIFFLFHDIRIYKRDGQYYLRGCIGAYDFLSFDRMQEILAAGAADKGKVD